MTHWTEAQIIQMIAHHFGPRPDLAPHGIGDDCACICDNQRLISTDASIENVHFDLNWMTLADAAYRCLTSNISDVAAMGAYAGPFTLALGLPPTLAFDQIHDAIAALRQCIDDHCLPNCWLVGGDVVRSPFAFFSITILGNLPEWPFVTRNGAQPGDLIYVAGNPGYAAAGLEICRQTRPYQPEFKPFLNAFKRPLALTSFGPIIAQNRLATAMMDLSDGIFCDLPRLAAQSHIGAIIQTQNLVPSLELESLAKTLGIPPLDWMICGGEDFGLLVTVAPNHQHDFEILADSCHIPHQKIGICTSQPDIQWMNGNDPIQICDHSFSHF